MHLILFENKGYEKLYPFTLSRHTSEIRVGILTLRQAWERALKTESQVIGRNHVCKSASTGHGESIYLDATILPLPGILAEIKALKPETGLELDGKMIAFRSGTWFSNPLSVLNKDSIAFKAPVSELKQINYPEDIFTLCGTAIELDYELKTHGKRSEEIEEGTIIIGDGEVFLEKGARVLASIINTENGPVYIGKNALVMEGCLIRGPFALGDDAQLKMGAKIYGPTSIGPACKVGGEVSNSVIFGYSNKAHDGFLGNSVIGEWCNLGADTNTSNLKNTYSEVSLYDIANASDRKTGKTFCGLMMGDHSKCGINTMFNTGTLIGFSANVFGAGFPPKYIPSFSWGGAEAMETFNPEKAMELAKRVMSRRDKAFTESEKTLFEKEFELSKKQRP